jgi:hypothetical protein
MCRGHLTLSYVEVDVLQFEGGVVCGVGVFPRPEKEEKGYTNHVGCCLSLVGRLAIVVCRLDCVLHYLDWNWFYSRWGWILFLECS